MRPQPTRTAPIREMHGAGRRAARRWSLLLAVVACGSYELERLWPVGAVVRGLNLRDGASTQDITWLERDAARHGFLVFPNVSLPGAELLRVSKLFGSGEIAALHTAHEETPHEDILRLSNDPRRGIVGVGPQWHADGFFERRPFSHVLFHAERMPAGGGGTDFVDLAAAHDALPKRLQDDWSRLATVNAYSGAVHPLIARHPVTGRRCLCAHLGMVGAVVRWSGRACPTSFAQLEAMDPSVSLDRRCGHELLEYDEVRYLLRTLDRILSRPAHSATWRYSAQNAVGDLVLVDNLAAAHRASSTSHEPPSRGLRILHRTTVRGTWPVDPPPTSMLPSFAYIWGANPLDSGAWQGSDNFGVGLRWNDTLPMRN